MFPHAWLSLCPFGAPSLLARFPGSSHTGFRVPPRGCPSLLPPPFGLSDGIRYVNWHWLIPFPRRVTLFFILLLYSVQWWGGDRWENFVIIFSGIWKESFVIFFFFQKFSYSDIEGDLRLPLTGSAVVLRKGACCLREATKSRLSPS